MKSTRRRLIPALVLFLIGLILIIIGALFKIQHWPYGRLILTIGNLIEVVGIALAIIILIRVYRSKS